MQDGAGALLDVLPDLSGIDAQQALGASKQLAHPRNIAEIQHVRLRLIGQCRLHELQQVADLRCERGAQPRERSEEQQQHCDREDHCRKFRSIAQAPAEPHVDRIQQESNENGPHQRTEERLHDLVQRDRQDEASHQRKRAGVEAITLCGRG